MIPLPALVTYLDELLDIENVPDYPPAHNGLQLTSSTKEVRKIVAAVDASLPVIRAAAEREADLLLVHHGMFWNGQQMITGANYEKLRIAMDAGLAIYSSHIPLDMHAVFGNNAQLAAALGFAGQTTPFFPWKSIQLGVRTSTETTRAALLDSVEAAVGAPVHHCPGGPEEIREIGIITGGAGSEIFDIAKTGIDTFITGEGPHWSYPAAEELGINLIYAGHYQTETFGVKALAQHASEQFEGVTWEFYDHPTGL